MTKQQAGVSAAVPVVGWVSACPICGSQGYPENPGYNVCIHDDRMVDRVSVRVAGTVPTRTTRRALNRLRPVKA